MQEQQRLPKGSSRSFAAVRLSLENTISPKANNTKITDKAYFLRCMKIKLILKFRFIIIILYENVLKIEVFF